MKMHFFISLPLLLSTLFLSLCNAQRNTTFQVGVILDSSSLNGPIANASLSLALSDFYSVHSDYSTRIVLHIRDSKTQVTAAADALNLLKDVQVDAIIGPQTSAQANLVAGLGDAAHVPVISYSATSPSLRPQTRYFVRTAINDSAQVDAVAAIVKYCGWHQVVFIYEDSDYGNGIIPYLFNAFQLVNARVSYRSVIPISALKDDFIIDGELKKMKNMQTRVFVMHTTALIASKIFLKAKEAEMMGEGYVWIVTSGLMNLFYSLSSSVVESMQGVVGVKPLVRGSSKLETTTIRWRKKFEDDNPGSIAPPEMNLYGVWAYDTLWALALAAEKTGFRESSYLQNTSASNSTDIFITGTSQTGLNLLTALLDTKFEGLAGNDFTLVNGQLEPSSFQILNVKGKGLTQVGKWAPLLQSSSSKRNTNMTGFSGEKLEDITWPGESRNVPKGWEVSVSGKKLRVGVPAKAGFPEFVKVEKDNITGLYIDLFKSVMAVLPYVVEYEFVPFEISNASTTVQTSNATSAGSYNDLSYQVFNGNFDAAVGDITITAKRSEYVDFTLPIAQGGITITQRIEYDDKSKGKVFFVKPLKRNLWLTAIAMFIFTGMALWILEHRFNRDFRGPPSEHVGLIFYIPFMTLVFANKEKIVSNLARLVLVVWVFVVLILSSTYTATLTAKFTHIELKNADTDVSKLIRSGHFVGCREGSFVCEYVERLGFDKSKIKTYKRPEEFDSALSEGSGNGGIRAMFTRTPYADLFLSKYCNKKYMRVGQPYLTEGFAFVFPKGSPLVADVSRAIIEQTDSGNVSSTNKNWLIHTCEEYDASKGSWQSIKLKSFKVLFGITAGFTGTCLVVFLVVYFYRNRDFIRMIFSNSTATAWSKLRTISKHFDQRDPRSFRSKEEGGINASPNQNVHHDCCGCSSREETPSSENARLPNSENIRVV